MNEAFCDALDDLPALIRDRIRRALPAAAVFAATLLVFPHAASAQAAAPASKSAGPAAMMARVHRATVPRVSGLELSKAIADLRVAGFEAVPIPEGTAGGSREVTRTDPAAGTLLTGATLPKVQVYHRRKPEAAVAPTAKPNRTTSTTTNTGAGSAGRGNTSPSGATTSPQQQTPPQATVTPRMPSLIGATCIDARQRLMSLGRAVASCDVGPTTGGIAAGRINRQEPAPETLLTGGTTIRAWTEPQTTLVPDVSGLAVQDAVQRVQAARLRADIPAQAMDRWHWVAAQSPPAGTRVVVDSAVRLGSVARYVMPDLTGLPCQAARDRVAGSGFGGLACQTELAVAGAVQPERIHRQDPAPKTVSAVPRTVTAWVQPAPVTVPNVVGLPEDAANAQLTQRQLRPQPSGPLANAGRQVAVQSPLAGSQVLPTTAVRITLQLSVPSVKGLGCDAARARAREHGLPDSSCVLRRATSSDPINQVFNQRPPAGTLLATAQPLVAEVAEPVVVPDVVGQPLPAALATLRQAGLAGGPDASDGDREVRSQKPLPGAQVAPGSTVALATTRFAPVPAVVGLALPEAIGRLRSKGFGAVDDVPPGAPRDDRKARTQAPEAGTRSAIGTRVVLTSYREVVVPDVVKSRLPDALSRLEQAGLKGKPDRQDDAAQREVRAQAPAAGERVPEQNDVALTTVRMVVVPDLRTLSYSDAGASARVAGVKLERCTIEPPWIPTFLEAMTTVTSHTPGGRETVDEGSVVTCVGQPRRALVVATATTTTLTLLAGGLLVLRRHRLSVKLKAAVATATWRPEPDPRPLIDLHLAFDNEAEPWPPSGGTDRDSAEAGDTQALVPTIVWRRSWGDPSISVHGKETLEVERDEHPA